MGTRNWIALLLLFVSLGVLYPGLTEPILHLEISIKLPFMDKQTLFEQTQSILQSIETLHKNDNTFVAFLILLFSVMVPVIKAIILLVTFGLKNTVWRYRFYLFVRSIGKWSMADVFVVGVFIAFLATKSTAGLEAALHPGFYWFLAYCMISLLSLQFMKIENPGEM